MSRGETAHRLVGGRYALLERLGQGGMGVVWRARDELLRRHVAVKQVTLPPTVGGTDAPAARQRVLREARAAARLSHPSSVTVFDVLEDHDSVHIVMELLDARTLAQVVEGRGPLAVHEAARLGLDLVGALDAAHHQGVVHRDVKPSNVMMLADGGVKLTDFGIASVKGDPGLTSTGQIVGSPSYMAPEQALGSAVGPPADWWGLGATLYFAVEGRPPFERPGALPTLTAVVNDDPAPAERAGPMASLLGRLLAKDPELRPGAPELRSRLRLLAGGTATIPTRTGDDALRDARPRPPVPPAPPPERKPTGSADGAVAGAAPARARPGRNGAHPVEPGPGAARPAVAGRGPVVGAAVLAAALVAAGVAWSAWSGDDGDRAGTDRAAPPSTAAPASPSPSTGAAGASTTAARREGVPADWVDYTDPAVGYRIAHPPGWEVRRLDGTRTDITDPETGSYLRVDWTDTPGPSPEGAWEALSESFGSRHEDYQEIRIEPTTYQGFDAAVWEYAYTAGGARLHAVNLGMVTDRHGFALNFQTREDRWESSLPLFEAFKASFRVPG